MLLAKPYINDTERQNPFQSVIPAATWPVIEDPQLLYHWEAAAGLTDWDGFQYLLGPLQTPYITKITDVWWVLLIVGIVLIISCQVFSSWGIVS